MARETYVRLTDDVEAAEGNKVEAVTTREFGVAGQRREIDLSEKNAAKFDAQMQFWVERSRPVGATRKKPSSSTRLISSKPTASGYSKEQLDAVRNWARKNGYTVSDRGRVSGEIQAAFEAAGGLTLVPDFSSL